MEYINSSDVIGYCLDLMNKMRWILINVLRIMSCSMLGLPKGYLNDVMFYFYLMPVMVGITDLILI